MRPLIIGLTGGIGSGKSTVAGMFRDLGAEVIDADVIARDVVRKGQPAYEDIAGAFGTEILDSSSGEINRRKLADRVFSNPADLERLMQLTHPRIQEEARARFDEAAGRKVEVILYEASLLVERGVYRDLDGLIVVSASAEQQLHRAIHRGGLTAKQAHARLAAQLPQAEKLKVADYVVSNEGSLEETRARVEDVWTQIRARAGQKKG